MDTNTASSPKPDFDEAFETAHGPALTRELMRLTRPGVRELISGSGPADALRDSYPEYWADGNAPSTRTAANTELEAFFPHTTGDRLEHLCTLVRFAVHTEMKHWENPGYVLNPDHGYELLIEESDYTDETDFLEQGQEKNQELWATLANTASVMAAAEDAGRAAVRRAA